MPLRARRAKQTETGATPAPVDLSSVTPAQIEAHQRLQAWRTMADNRLGQLDRAEAANLAAIDASLASEGIPAEQRSRLKQQRVDVEAEYRLTRHALTRPEPPRDWNPGPPATVVKELNAVRFASADELQRLADSQGGRYRERRARVGELLPDRPGDPVREGENVTVIEDAYAEADNALAAQAQDEAPPTVDPFTLGPLDPAVALSVPIGAITGAPHDATPHEPLLRGGA